MSSEPVKKCNSNEVSAIIASYLDAKDGNKDNQISKQEWNLFADYTGLDPTDKDYVPIEDATAGLDILMVNNPEKVINYSNKYLGKKITRNEDKIETKKTANKQENEETNKYDIIENILIAALLVAKPVWGATYLAAKNSKPLTDALIKQFIIQNDIETVRETIKTAAKSTSSKLPLSSELLNISATPSKLTQGKHDHYTVLSPKQAEKELAKIGMHADDVNEFGKPIDHLISDKMKLPMVVFNNNTTASKTISKSNLVNIAIQTWEKEGRPKKKNYSGAMNEKRDELLAINNCIITLTECNETDKTKTYKGYMEDVYDFDETYSDDLSTTKAKFIDTINKGAFLAQKKGAIKNYRILIPFSVTVDKK